MVIIIIIITNTTLIILSKLFQWFNLQISKDLSNSRHTRNVINDICPKQLSALVQTCDACYIGITSFVFVAYDHFCKDESTEELYEIGHIWRRNCTILSCDESLKITQREAGCPQGCLIDNNNANKCCPVCQSKLTCTAKEIVIAIPLPLLRDADPVRLGLSDPKCRPIVNSSHVTFRTELSACGTELSKTPNGFKYSNFLQKNPSMSKIVVRPWLKFSCFYRSKVSYTHYQQVPSFRVSLSTLKQNKQITIHYTSEYGDIFEGQSKMRFVKGSHVYVAVFGNKISPDSHYLVLESCILTSTRISNRRQLISKG